MDTAAPPTPSRALRAWGWVVLFLASLVLFLGANVTSTKSGDATPDWPSSWGDQWSLLHELLTLPVKLRNELAHRYGVPLLGVAVIVLVVWAWRRAGSSGVRRLALWVVGVLVAQALLGGLRVKAWKFPYSEEVAGAAHALLAEVFVCALVALLALLSAERAAFAAPRRLSADSIALLRRAGLTFLLVALQIVLGVLGRHGFVPREVHAMFALVVVPVAVRLVLGLLGDTARDLGYLRRPGMLLGVLVASQVGLGIWTYLAQPHIDTVGATTLGGILALNLHMLFGAWTLGTALVILIRVIDVYGLPTDERVAHLLDDTASRTPDPEAGASA